MPDETADGEEDWVKQMLAEAMLGGPTSSAAPAAPATLPTIEPETTDVDAGLVADIEETASVASAVAPLAEIELEEVEVELAEPFVEAEAVDTEAVDTEPFVDTEAVDTEPFVDTEAVAAPSASRLFERPTFDATRDPGVDEMVAAEQTSRIEVIDAPPERSRWRGALEWVVVLGSAVVVALLLRAFLFQAFFIPSESMESTLLVDDRVLVNKLSYRFGDVQRGEVVVFRRPDNQPGEFRDLIKRVIGLPGETVEARDNTIFIDGQVLIEPYLTPGEVIGDFDPVLVPEGEYFVMGDNRDNSGDSRVFGPVAEDLLIGRAFFLFWPLDRVGSL